MHVHAYLTELTKFRILLKTIDLEKACKHLISISCSKQWPTCALQADTDTTSQLLVEAERQPLSASHLAALS